MRSIKRSLCIIFAALFAVCFCSLQARAEDGEAVKLSPALIASNGAGTANITDDSYGSKVDFAAGDSLTIRVGEGQSIGGIYLKWHRIPGEWRLRYGDGSVMECGKNGFLHEYVSIEDGGISECVMEFPAAAGLCDIYVYSPGKLPADVQTWKTPLEKADMLFFSTHADDEALFFGGALATYAGGRELDVQVVYMTTYWDILIVREHEKLDGLWTMGVKNYPVNGFTPDEYVTTVEAAEKLYGKDKWIEFIAQQVRRFKPQIVISQDFNGEYGHVAHILKADCIKEVVENSMNADFCPSSAAQYGTWDVPKTYYHLYWENQIHLDLRQPISALGGKTAVETAAAAYLCHQSQQWCWFYVSDDPNDPKADKINCAEYGLFRSTVGADTGNDMMEHIVSYKEQDRIAEEARMAEEARLAEEKKAKEEEEAQKAREQEIRIAAAEEESIQEVKKLSAGGVAAGILTALLLTVGVMVYTADKRR